jgi:hypothetical protein
MAEDAARIQALADAQANIVQLQQQVTALLAAVQANANAPQQVPPAQPGPVPPAVFALSPARVSADPIDYATNTGAKIYAAAITPLPQKYDLTTGKLKSFIALLADKANGQGWTQRILTIPTAGGQANLLTKYGIVSELEVMAHVVTYANTQTRQAQDSFQMYHCIHASLEPEALDRVLLQQDRYLVNGEPHGPLLFKVIVSLAHIDTNATTRMIQERLSSTDKIMEEVAYNVQQFNEKVQDLLNSLYARSQTMSESTLIAHLFKGYKMVPDQEFVLYVQQKQNDYDEGGAIQTNQLMELVLNKYKILVEAGTWNKADDTKDRVFALEARTNQMAKQLKGPGKPRATPSATKPAKKQSEGNKKGKANDGWKKVAPKEGEKRHKMSDGKDFYWCPNHKAWTRHKPDECKGIDFKHGKSDVKSAMAHAATIDNSDEYESST